MSDNKNDIKAIVFDVGGVLANNLSWYNGWGEWFDKSLTDKVEEARKEAWMRIKVGACSLEQFWRDCFAAAELDADELVNGVPRWRVANQHLSSQFFPYNFTLAMAQRLKERGYVIAICSNHALDWFVDILQRFRFRDIFTDESLVVASYAVECAKPSEQIFDVVMDRLRAKLPDIQPCQVAFFDDQLKNTSVAAKRGIKAVLYDADVDGQQGLVDKLSALGVNCRLN